MPLSLDAINAIDKTILWHPYASLPPSIDNVCIESAQGVELHLKNGNTLIDGMSSWWSTIHGYNHPILNSAVTSQLEKMSHVMFGGLTHEPAAKLAKKLIDISPSNLHKVFFSDSGSVAVEVAIKMAIQFWHSQGNKEKNRLLTIRNGYHGDTFATMAVCDPITGMHHLFDNVLTKHIFSEQPSCRFFDEWDPSSTKDIEYALEKHSGEVAAVILEPIVQGAGGMYFYHREYLKYVRALCDEYNVLLIADEIATGFGRTGEMFACNHADISPDIMCVGKALTGGYLTLAATLCSDKIARGICDGEAGVFMHGPTFMANPLACNVAYENLSLLQSYDWRNTVKNIETQLCEELTIVNSLPTVKEVRVLGAIGVVELNEPVNMKVIQPKIVDHGIWLRPFGKLIYMMPPYIISKSQLTTLTSKTVEVLNQTTV